MRIPLQIDPHMNSLERWLMQSWFRRGCQLWEHSVLRRMGLAVRPGDKVLELGCGAGWMACRLAPLCARYVGVDLDEESTSQATLQSNSRNLSFFARDCADLSPFADESFDVVLSFGLLHHADRWRAVLQEATRVLRPGGTLALDDFTRQGLAKPWHRLFNGPVEGHFAVDELRAGLAGFKTVNIERWLFGDVVFVVARKSISIERINNSNQGE